MRHQSNANSEWRVANSASRAGYSPFTIRYSLLATPLGHPACLTEDGKAVLLQPGDEGRTLLVAAIRFRHDDAVHNHQYPADDGASGITGRLRGRDIRRSGSLWS